MMRRWHWIALVVCIASTAVVWMRAQALRQVVSPVIATVETPQAEAAAETPAGAAEAESSEVTRELARLRNEVVLLRAQTNELKAAQRENAELKLASSRAADSPARTSSPGFTSKEKLSNVGYTTPADAVQTFFWAMRDGNFEAMVASFAPSSKERQRFEQMSPEQREKLRQKMSGQSGRPNPIEQLSDVGVRNQEDLSGDIVAVDVGSSLGTNTVRMRLERTAEGWKVHDPGF